MCRPEVKEPKPVVKENCVYIAFVRPEMLPNQLTFEAVLENPHCGKIRFPFMNNMT